MLALASAYRCDCCCVFPARITNDIFGRGQGDLVLAGIAERLRSCLRSGDLYVINQMAQESGLVARLGDNAFSASSQILTARIGHP